MPLWRPACSVAALRERGRLLREIRRFFDERDVLEVQTAVLAAHGVTDVAIENIEAEGRFLQSSPEFQMKRLLAAGVPSIYQIGPAFRAGEAGRWHNPEFTMLEWYRVGFDLAALMDEVKDLTDIVLGRGAYETVTVRAILESAFGLTLDADEGSLRDACAAEGLEGDYPRVDRIDYLLGLALARLAAERVFVTGYPPEQAALAKVVDLGGERVAARFELVVDGLEIANGYDELTDAAELDRRMTRDNAERVRRGLVARAEDRHLLEAMRAGLPECAGVAVGLDRLFALAMGASSLDEVLPFPIDRA